MRSVVSNGHERIVRLPMEKKADISIQDNLGLIVLHESSQENKLGIVELLLSHDADANATDQDGWTSLHTAGVHGNEDVARILARRKSL